MFGCLMSKCNFLCTYPLSTGISTMVKQTKRSEWNCYWKTLIRQKHKSRMSYASSDKPYKIYMSFSRAVRFILIDDQPIDKTSFFNQLQTINNVNANIVATSCQLDYYLDKLKNQSSISKNLNVESVDDETFDIDNMFLSESEINSLNNVILPSSNVGEYQNLTNKEPKAVKDFILKDKARSVAEWKTYFKELQEHCSGRSFSLLFRAMFSFFIDVAELKQHITLVNQANWITFPLVQSFVRYMIEDDESFQYAQPALTMYLSCCLSNNDIKAFYDLFNKISPKIKVYGDSLLHLFVQGLSSNQHLNEAKELLVLQKTYKDKQLLYNVQRTQTSFGVGCFESDDLTTGIKILIQSMQVNNSVNDSLLNAFLNRFCFVNDVKQWKEHYEIVTAFFNYLKVNEIFLDANLISCIVKWFSKIESENWFFGTFQNYQVRYGECPITKTKMKTCQLTSEEFNYLEQSCSQLLLKNAIEEDISLKYIQEDVPKAKSNLIYQSSVKDIRKFLEYMNDEGPFDLIVDGMNSVYFLEPYTGHYKFFGKHKHQKALHGLKNGLLYYKQNSQNPNLKICLIFRHHMFDIVREEGKFLFDICNVYFAHSRVSDDILMLYGSMSSGPNCYFASHDLFRNYREFIAKLDDVKLTRLFDKYQCSRQIFFKNYKNKVSLRNSLTIEPEISYSESSWHFPYFRNATDKLKGNLPSSWLCVTKKLVHPHFKYVLN